MRRREPGRGVGGGPQLRENVPAGVAGQHHQRGIEDVLTGGTDVHGGGGGVGAFPQDRHERDHRIAPGGGEPAEFGDVLLTGDFVRRRRDGGDVRGGGATVSFGCSGDRHLDIEQRGQPRPVGQERREIPRPEHRVEQSAAGRVGPCRLGQRRLPSRSRRTVSRHRSDRRPERTRSTRSRRRPCRRRACRAAPRAVR